MSEEIINKVANSGIVSLDLETFITSGERIVFDIKPLLFHELILKEQDFRNFIKTNDWTVYQDKLVALTCTADAIVPTWAYMLLSIALEPYAKRIVFGTLQELDNLLFAERLAQLNTADYKDTRVVIKGCGDVSIPINAYVQIASMLKPIVKSMMYGEPCSTVPLYKAKNV
jgi:hypothetical protein